MKSGMKYIGSFGKADCEKKFLFFLETFKEQGENDLVLFPDWNTFFTVAVWHLLDEYLEKDEHDVATTRLPLK